MIYYIAREGRVVHGPAIRGKKLRVEPSCGYIICGERHADDGYVLFSHHSIVDGWTHVYRGGMDVGDTHRRRTHCRTRLRRLEQPLFLLFRLTPM